MDKPSKRLWAQEGMPGLSIRQLYSRQEAARWPFIYGCSPAVVPRPPDWREGIEVAGYWWPAHPADWTPPADLGRFLAAGPPPVFVGFGSRNPADAARITAVVADPRRRAGVPTVSVPMITDQPFWASRVTALGAGPAAVRYKSLTTGSLTAAIGDAVNRDSYRTRAQAIARQLATEDGTLPVIRALDRLTA